MSLCLISGLAFHNLFIINIKMNRTTREKKSIVSLQILLTGPKEHTVLYILSNLRKQTKEEG